jgi:hypothetical protein
MDKYISGRQRQLKVGLSSYSENRTVIQTTGKVGIGTTNAEQYSLKVIGDTNIVGDLIVSNNIDLETLRVAGVSTFTNGPVLIGTGTSTGTTNQKLQVNGGVYVSDNVGVNTETPQDTLHVVGTVAVQDPTSSNRFYLEHNSNTNSLDFIYI